MRVLFINSNTERSPWPVPPMGACSVASGASEAGHSVQFLDLCFEERIEGAILGAIEGFRPEIIAITVRNIDNLDWQKPVFYLETIKSRIVKTCRAHARCPIVLGGPAAGMMPKELLEYLGVDFLIRGDGEVAFLRLLEAIGSGRGLQTVPGLVYKDKESGQVHVGDPDRVSDLDSLPMPQAHRWLDLKRYFNYNGSYGIQTKRGCALTCSYCAYNQIEGSCYRLKSVPRILREIASAIHEAKAPSIEFTDSTFNIPLEHALGICRALAERKFPVTFSTMGINPGAVTEELFGLMKEGNFSEVSITPETGSAAMLRSLGKNFTLEQVARAAEISRKFNMPIVWYFMFGAPGENRQTVRETLEFIAKHVPSNHLVLLVSGIRIFRGAPLEAIARQEGQLAPDDNLLRPVWYRMGLSREEMSDLIDEALRRHYNYISLQDNLIPAPLLRAAYGVHHFLRMKRPLWQYLRYVRWLLCALRLPPHLLTQFSGPGRKPSPSESLDIRHP